MSLTREIRTFLLACTTYGRTTTSIPTRTITHLPVWGARRPPALRLLRWLTATYMSDGVDAAPANAVLHWYYECFATDAQGKPREHHGGTGSLARVCMCVQPPILCTISSEGGVCAGRHVILNDASESDVETGEESDGDWEARDDCASFYIGYSTPTPPHLTTPQHACFTLPDTPLC